MVSANKLGVLVLALLSVAIACSSPGAVERAIVESASDCRTGPRCELALSDVTQFDWDTAYAFKYTASRADRESAVKHRMRYAEFKRELVFMKDGVIVWREVEPTNIEHPVKDEVVFDIADNANFRKYDHSARFAVHVEHGPEGPYYLLRQIN